MYKARSVGESTAAMSTPVVAPPKPSLVPVRGDRAHHWCACGCSSRQLFSGRLQKCTELNPVMYAAERNDQRLFCGGEHTYTRPFRDGAHPNLPGGSLRRGHVHRGPQGAGHRGECDFSAAKQIHSRQAASATCRLARHQLSRGLPRDSLLRLRGCAQLRPGTGAQQEVLRLTIVHQCVLSGVKPWQRITAHESSRSLWGVWL